MATSKDYIEFVCEQLKNIENVTYKKMFGEYMVYVNKKPVLIVCDNTVMVKKHSVLNEIMKDAPCGYPYDGAKEHYVLDIENTELCEKAVLLLEEVTPLPKPRKPKK